MPVYKILDWIDTDKLNMEYVSFNPKSAWFLENNPDKINWKSASGNTAASHLLENNVDKIDWNIMSYNSGAGAILKKHVDRINWNNILANTSNDAFELVSKNTDKITNWSKICWNTNPWINKLLCKDDNISKLSKEDISILSGNPVAIPTIEQYLDKMDWSQISENENAFELLLAHPDKIDFLHLHRNIHPDAYKLYDVYSEYIRCMPYNFNEGYAMIPYIKKRHWMIDSWICNNTNQEAEYLIRDFINEQDELPFLWGKKLSANPVAVDIMKERLEYIDWFSFCQLEEAVDIIRENINKLDDNCWKCLSSNSSAVPVLEQYPDKLDWNELSKNDGIYEEIV